MTPNPEASTELSTSAQSPANATPGSNPGFMQAYRTLQQNAEYLRTQTEPDIDELLVRVAESVKAYRICKERIDAVEAALEKTLAEMQEPGEPGSSESAP